LVSNRNDGFSKSALKYEARAAASISASPAACKFLSFCGDADCIDMIDTDPMMMPMNKMIVNDLIVDLFVRHFDFKYPIMVLCSRCSFKWRNNIMWFLELCLSVPLNFCFLV